MSCVILSCHESQANAGKDFTPLSTQLVEEEYGSKSGLWSFILFSVSPSESDTLINQPVWSESSVWFSKK